MDDAFGVSFETTGGLRCTLGEAPDWDEAAGLLRWVDIEAGTVWEAPVRGDGLGAPRVTLHREPTLSAVVHSQDGDLLLARRGLLEHLDATGDSVAITSLVPPGVASRLNDGKCDPAGRFLVGSMALDARIGSERLWRLEHDGSITVLDDDLTTSNGLAWSPDGATMYQVDSVPGTVWMRTYDPDTGAVGRRHTLVHVLDGSPDGLTVDADGNLWLAVWRRGQVRVLSPGGDQLDCFDTGAPLTTSCSFAGPDLALLVVTSARQEVEGVRNTERSGAVLTRPTTQRGLPATPWQPPSPR